MDSCKEKIFDIDHIFAKPATIFIRCCDLKDIFTHSADKITMEYFMYYDYFCFDEFVVKMQQ